MPSKEPCTCPVCQRPGIVNLSQHLNGVHSICGQERKQLIRGGLIGTEVMTGEPQSNIEEHANGESRTRNPWITNPVL